MRIAVVVSNNSFLEASSSVKLLDKYSNDEIDDLTDQRVLKLPEFNEYGSPIKIAKLFGGLNGYLAAVHSVQTALYAASYL